MTNKVLLTFVYKKTLYVIKCYNLNLLTSQSYSGSYCITVHVSDCFAGVLFVYTQASSIIDNLSGCINILWLSMFLFVRSSMGQWR